MKIVPRIINFTATGLTGTPWESNVPPLTEQMAALTETGRRLPPRTIRWCFDPIIATEDWRKRFTATEELLEQALGEGELDHVTVSFPDCAEKQCSEWKTPLCCGLNNTGKERSALAWMVE